MAISRMQAADTALVGLLPDAMFAGELPRIRDTVQHYLPVDDPRRQYLEDPAQYDAKHPDPAGIVPANVAAGTGPDKGAGRYRIEGALRGAYVTNGFTRGRLRQFNKILLVAAFVLMGLTLLLGFIDASWPSSLTCTKALNGVGEICPLGSSSNPSDVFIVELIGAAGAAMSAVVSLSRSRSVEDPYMVHVAQAVLKVSLGGITAVLGLLLLFAAPGIHLESQWQILAYAVIFGYSQQLFTRLVDSKGEELQKAASPTTKQMSSPDG
ncbi:hypothetical protein [Streptomyces sp. SPB162]|uniref:hypothetical protein n=1 Tax=Streptomyces sp. SPB162 TaxID=2940560 RepID=UPI0024072334|nr:hypothetical protein [Streptomyces sp. SPB162]